MKGWKESNQTRSHKTWQTEAIISTFLFTLTMIGVVFIITTHQKSTRIAEINWQSTLDASETQMSALRGDLKELDKNYNGQIEQNQVLHTDLAERLVEVNALKEKVVNAEKQLKVSKQHSEEIRNRLAQLEDLKTELEADMLALTEQNVLLEQTNGQLQKMVIASQVEVDQLSQYVAQLTLTNTHLEQRIAQIAPAGFTADNFVITAHRKNSKLTSKASRAEVINVAFDIANVPAQYRRDHEIYLVVTDFEGLPLEHVPSTHVTIRTGDDKWPVQAVDAETVQIAGNQIVAMTIAPDQDLEPGTYNLMVYADNGFLGATGFQLQ